MSGSTVGTHLQQEALSGSNATRELQKFAAWLNKDGRAFEVINPGYSKCTDTEKNEAIRPLVKELGFNDEGLLFNVFRITGSSYITLGTGRGAYLIPIQQESEATEAPAISTNQNFNEPTTKLAVGIRVYFDRNVWVRSNFDCVVIKLP
ncbi:hypothetical protein V494_01837 [Pseudogymnoascus sp. VKM F-4513 (FW-928)]|nr:hypothetical protein V490_00430 [Pseudogymnoascus sp. VKM F-3557]KFY43730.1 hypothetical protein V494_01837 [Pseudogymnoascus sp. VKM F-4513 (FW-928)]